MINGLYQKVADKFKQKLWCNGVPKKLLHFWTDSSLMQDQIFNAIQKCLALADVSALRVFLLRLLISVCNNITMNRSQ